ncbi:glycosyl transferase group 1 [Prosthecochloris aestuarii DSM 271]|uniref:Glycosyl transferase group 1 n=1 Tax=Prosthecochloris aestuarii (strain DSM 271 / SK 413) TaxID=290512 RepID=B4S4G7_PROA2|nr:glycosyltransferase [Prosthecochloris aestuarii]ACF45415.1 glycosyl transferase group 1 [Prosthecochloris aestuarii DSM 271]
MNIAFINSARTWGGTEKWTLMASEALSETCDVVLIYRKALVGDRFSVTRYPLPLISHLDLFSLARIVEIIKKEQIDIIIPTKRKDYVLAGMAAGICGISSVIRLGIDRKLKIPIIHKLIYRDLTDGIIVNAERTKQTLLESRFMQGQKIQVIYNGLDTKKIDAEHSHLPPRPSGLVVTAMGILTFRKGFDFLIRGFARFLVQSPQIDATLVIIGSGPQHETFRALAQELLIADRVIFTGFLENPLPWLKQSDIFAMTSTNEGISNALLEAMYLNNAPICTRAGGTEEIITDRENGLLIPYGDEQKLASAIEELAFSTTIRERLSANAHRSVVNQFSSERMKKELEAFLHRVIDASASDHSPSSS